MGGMFPSTQSWFDTVQKHKLLAKEMDMKAKQLRKRRYAKARNRIRDRKRGLRDMDELSEPEFRRMFRMSRTVFNKLLRRLRRALSVDRQKAINSSGSYISPRTRLAATIRWLAGGSHLDICVIFGLDPGNFFGRRYVLWKTMEVLDDELELGFDLNASVLDSVAADYERASHGVLRHCVSALDGWVVRTRKPTVKEAGLSVKSYRNRKGFWGVLVLAGCDAKCRFNIFSCQWSGGTHDCMAWEGCEMSRVLARGQLPEKYYFIGDEAFVNSPQFLVPWSGRGLGPWKDSFNYHLSAARQCIERAFGLLSRRWGVFWRPLEVSLSRWGLVCTVAAKLHNYLIDEGEAETAQQHTDNTKEGDICVVIDNNDIEAEDGELFAALRPSGRTRADITSSL